MVSISVDKWWWMRYVRVLDGFGIPVERVPSIAVEIFKGRVISVIAAAVELHAS